MSNCSIQILVQNSSEFKMKQSNIEIPSIIMANPGCVVVDEMPEKMRDDAILFTLEALEKYHLEQNIASHIKYLMVRLYYSTQVVSYECLDISFQDTAYGPQFHVVVGRHFGCKVTHELQTCLVLEFHGYKILIFKAG